MGATRCQILRLKCTKFTFCWGSAPDPAGGAYSAPDLCIYLRGLLLRRWREKGEGEEKVKGKEGGGGGSIWPTQKFWCGAPMITRKMAEDVYADVVLASATVVFNSDDEKNDKLPLSLSSYVPAGVYMVVCNNVVEVAAIACCYFLGYVLFF